MDARSDCVDAHVDLEQHPRLNHVTAVLRILCVSAQILFDRTHNETLIHSIHLTQALAFFSYLIQDLSLLIMDRVLNDSFGSKVL